MKFKPLMLLALLFLGFFLAVTIQTPQVHALGVPIVRVQGTSAYNGGVVSNVNVTLFAAPTNGNVLVATLGLNGTAPIPLVNNITQTGVNWTRQVYKNDTYLDAEIWFGVVSAGASATAAVYSTSAITGEIGIIIAEYSGVATSSYLDKNATGSGAGATFNSGATSTSLPNMLDVAAGVIAVGGNFTSPTNGYTLYDNSTLRYFGYFEKINAVIGEAANVTATANPAGQTYGCIAVFRGASGPGSYLITGPYYEDNGYVANSNVTVTAYFSNGEQQIILLNGTVGTAQTIALNQTLTPTFVSWQATTSINYTRLNYLTNTTSANITIFIPNPASTPYVYQFTISDFGSMIDPYIESAMVVDGNLTQQQYVIERKPITASTVSLIMEQWHTYNIILQCTSGSYTILFSAENSFLTNLNAAPLLFPYPTPLTNFTAIAEATNTTNIRTSYADYDNITSQLSITIFENQGNFQTIDYNATINNFNVTYPTGIYILDWNNMVSTKSYAVSINATRNGVVYSWTYAIVASNTSPFAGVFNFLGTWPNGVDPAQIIGAVFVVLAGVGIFSYFGTAMGCAFSWIVAGILAVIGWFTISAPLFVFAGIVTFFIYIDEGKKTVREM